VASIPFLDRFLRPAGATNNPRPTRELGLMGTAIYGGYIDDRERNPELQASQRYTTYSNLLANTSIVAASVRHFLNLVTAVDWHAEPPKGYEDSAEAKQLADFVNNTMHDMKTPFFRVIRRGAMFRYWGFSVQEWIAKKREQDGQIGFLDISPRPQNTITRWDVTPGGEVLGMVQEPDWAMQEIYLPRGKVLYLVDDSLNDSPEGFGLFRHLAEPASRLANLQKLEIYGYEMDLKGVPIGRAPLMELERAVADGEITAELAQKELNSLTDFIRNHIKSPKLGLVLDSQTWESSDEAARPSGSRQWDIETLKSESAEGAQAVGVALERIQREMARITGTEGLLIGGDGKGSMALSKDKTGQMALATDSTIKELRHVMDNDYIGTLWLLNGFDPALKPRTKTDTLRHRDVQEVTSALQDLALAGATLNPDDPAIQQVRDLLGLDRVPPDIVERTLDSLLNPVVEDPNAPNPNAPSTNGGGN